VKESTLSKTKKLKSSKGARTRKEGKEKELLRKSERKSYFIIEKEGGQGMARN